MLGALVANGGSLGGGRPLEGISFYFGCVSDPLGYHGSSSCLMLMSFPIFHTLILLLSYIYFLFLKLFILFFIDSFIFYVQNRKCNIIVTYNYINSSKEKRGVTMQPCYNFFFSLKSF